MNTFLRDISFIYEVNAMKLLDIHVISSFIISYIGGNYYD